MRGLGLDVLIPNNEEPRVTIDKWLRYLTSPPITRLNLLLQLRMIDDPSGRSKASSSDREFAFDRVLGQGAGQAEAYA